MSDQTMKQKLEHGAFSWNELLTSDVPGAKAFYSQLFGWSFEDSAMPTGIYSIAKTRQGQQVAGILSTSSTPDPDMPPFWGSYVTVQDIEDTLSKVEALGGKVILPPTEVPGIGHFAVIQDPQGAYISTFQYSHALTHSDC